MRWKASDASLWPVAFHCYMYTRIHIHMCKCTLYMYVCEYVCIYGCVRTYIHGSCIRCGVFGDTKHDSQAFCHWRFIFIHTHVYVYTCTNVYAYVFICMHVCIYICIQTRFVCFVRSFWVMESMRRKSVASGNLYIFMRACMHIRIHTNTIRTFCAEFFGDRKHETQVCRQWRFVVFVVYNRLRCCVAHRCIMTRTCDMTHSYM